MITSDASSVAIGASLHQLVEGESAPIAFYSRKLTKAEAAYRAFDRELLAVFAAVKTWRHLIHGHPTTVFCDHKPLIGAFKSTKERLSARQQRQLSTIAEYVTDIIHIPGVEKVVADSLSRDTAHPDGVTVVNIVQENSTAPLQFPADLPAIAKAQQEAGTCGERYRPFDVGLQDCPSFCERHHNLILVRSFRKVCVIK